MLSPLRCVCGVTAPQAGQVSRHGQPRPAAAAPHTKWRHAITASEDRCGGEPPLRSGLPRLLGKRPSAPGPAHSPERLLPPGGARSPRASSHRAVGLHRSLAAQPGTFPARVEFSAPPRPGRRPPGGEERRKPRRGAERSARPGGFGAVLRKAGETARREGRTAAAPPQRPARPRPPSEEALPPLPCPFALLSARKVAPRNARPAEAFSPAAIPAAPPGPAAVRTCACHSAPLLGLRPPRGSGFRAHAHLAPRERLAAGAVRSARGHSPRLGGREAAVRLTCCRPNGRKKASAAKPTAQTAKLRAGLLLGPMSWRQKQSSPFHCWCGEAQVLSTTRPPLKF